MVMMGVEKGGLFLFILNGILEQFLDYNMQQLNFRRPGWDGRKTGRLKHFDDGRFECVGLPLFLTG